MSFYGLSGAPDAFRIAKMVCDVLGHGSNHCAIAMLVETAQQETKLGRYRDPTPFGAGNGLNQFDLIAFDDVKRRTRKIVLTKIQKEFGVNLMNVQHRDLEMSPMLSMIFCRLFYRLIPEAIPTTIHGRGKYWKKYYNTVKGRGSILEYVEAAKLIPIRYEGL